MKFLVIATYCKQTNQLLGPCLLGMGAPKAHFPSQAAVILCYDSSMAGVGPSMNREGDDASRWRGSRHGNLLRIGF